MEHYFSENPNIKSNRRILKFDFLNETFTFTTDNGTFSKNHIDNGTKILLNEVVKIIDNNTTVLDIGCGYGVVGTIIKRKFKNTYITLTDVNKRALELARINLENNGIKKDFEILKSDLYENIHKTFDIIISNPPIRAGKKVIFELYRKSYEHLNPNGLFFCVIMTKHGAKSTEKELKNIYTNVTCLNISEGYRVYMGRK